jgi:DNA replication and repair protein RecF
MITDLRLQNFRSYSDESFEIDPGVNIVVGPNASGKTNLLEAVLMLALGNSYRAKDTSLVRFGSPWARLDAHTPDQTRVVKILQDGSKSFEIDGRELSRLHRTRILPTVIFEPNHLLLLSGAPDLRRLFLDNIIEQTTPEYASICRHYRRVLTQRNALLKSNPRTIKEQLFVWNLRLSELGGKIARERSVLTSQLSEQIGRLYKSLSGSPKAIIKATYTTQFPVSSYETNLLSRLDADLEVDILRGFTTHGPHREDLRININNHDAREVASRGEVRTIVLALKLVELQLLEESRGAKPLLLLDDVFSELDTRRRQALTKYVAGYQTFITTTDADVVVHHFTSSNIIPLGSF